MTDNENILKNYDDKKVAFESGREEGRWEMAKEIIEAIPESFAEVENWHGERPLLFIKAQLRAKYLGE